MKKDNMKIRIIASALSVIAVFSAASVITTTSASAASISVNEYIRIGSTGSYFLIGALILITIVVLIWGFTGTVPITTQKHGVIAESTKTDGVVCFIDAKDYTGKIPEGAKVSFTTSDRTTHKGHVVYMTQVPYSTGEAVYYDNMDMDSIDKQSLRRHIGTVLQEGKLFTGNIYSNIIISAPWMSMDDAWDAAEKAGMADHIRSLPMGMHTLISEG